jgi:hypothetical protein
MFYVKLGERQENTMGRIPNKRECRGEDEQTSGSSSIGSGSRASESGRLRA